MAYIGGIMLVLLIALTVVSVIGRSLNGILHNDFFQEIVPQLSKWALDKGVGPVNGDFELIEAGVAFSIFAFLPLCQITNSHASVEILTSKLSLPVNRIIQCVIDTIFALVLILIAVQLYSGLLSKMRSGQTTFLLEFPLWWAYALSLVGAIIAAVVGVYVAIVRTIELFGGNSILEAPASSTRMSHVD